MIRYGYLPFDQQVNGINFYDLTRLDWNQFKFTQGIRTYKLTKNDVERFYLVTQNFYDSLINEDLIYFVNKIGDPTELQIGQEIILPYLQDIENFLSSQLGVES